MSEVRMRRIVASAIVALMLWPACHFVLASRLGFDPWEFFGFAMYATPASRVQVRIDRVIDGRPVLVGLESDTRRRIAAWKRRRQALGPSIAVEPLARDVLSLEPEMDAIEVLVRTWRLDLDTARLQVDEERLRFDRSAAGS